MTAATPDPAATPSTAARGSAVGLDTPPPQAGRHARRAVARSAGRDRWLVGLVGVVLLLAGTGAALLAFGIFGTGRAQRSVLDPMIVDALRAQPLLWRIVAIVGGLLLLVLGLLWAIRSLSPERRPDLALDAGADTTLTVTAAAVADAVAGQARALPGISRARARMVGDERDPALRLTVWLAEDADVGEVCRRIPEEVLAAATDAFGGRALPVAVRIEADTEEGPRVR
ncbi:hypothetical protein Psed_2904 [Pseudonocardia dioxanivorans CB1190]|uniref:Alkaline shock response membrane anchor protein AmaP n=1 Tax=Pseudonocardia dioxanivorans (strain ATCC 55486 / DSM 44775 / JCM 13855 / CB1190) TaxID=675635 RepID=F4CPI7_PSEUX|nr:hypothetical protein [Pseudonocardia dioxanivorans]AEA25104.1 hypothetical protein Psed_2904 [Pseudonocardia dioxanivorans CB1190]